MTSEAFLLALKRSDLFSAEELAEIEAEVARSPGCTDVQIATYLFEQGKLTRWQAERLLSGEVTFYLRNYKLLDVIGKGGMGDVFKAEHTKMGRIVAVKVLSRAKLNNATAIARFRREVKAAANLDHPNIITAHDAGQLGDTHFLVMEYVEGRDLNAWIMQHGKLPTAWACEFIRQAALGLEHAHTRGMVHRDIKPANLLVTWNQSSEQWIVKILDLGLARSVRDAAEELRDNDSGQNWGDSFEAGVTQFGSIVGTPDYLAPEQIRGQTVDTRSDIFSLGVTLYKLLSGQVPFPGRNVVEKMQARVAPDAPLPPQVAKYRPDIPPDLNAIVMKMIAREPEYRFQNPGEVAEALAPFSNMAAGLGAAGADAPVLEGVADDSGEMHRSDALMPPPAYAPQSYRQDEDSGTREFLSMLSQTQAATATATSPAATAPVASSTVATPGSLPPTIYGAATAATATAADPRENLTRADWRLVLQRRRRRAKLFRYASTFLVMFALVPLAAWLVHDPGPAPWRRENAHKKMITALAAARSGDRFVTGGLDGQVLVWRIKDDALLARFSSHQDWVNDVAITSDGRMAASASSDETIRLWDLVQQIEVDALTGHEGPVECVDISPDGKFLVSGGAADGKGARWELPQGKLLDTWPAHGGGVYDIAISSDGYHVATTGRDMTVCYWSMVDRKRLDRFRCRDGAAYCVAISPDVRLLACGTRSKVYVWDLVGGRNQEPLELEGHRARVNDVAFSPDGRFLVSSSEDHTIRVWQLPGGESLGVLNGHTAGVSAAQFVLGSKWILSADRDRTLQMQSAPEAMLRAYASAGQ